MFFGWMLDGWLNHPVGGSLLTVAEAVHQSGTAKARGAASARVNSPHWNVGSENGGYPDTGHPKIAEMMINIDQPRDDRAWHYRQLTFMFPSINQAWKHPSWGIHTKRA